MSFCKTSVYNGQISVPFGKTKLFSSIYWKGTFQFLFLGRGCLCWWERNPCEVWGWSVLWVSLRKRGFGRSHSDGCRHRMSLLAWGGCERLPWFCTQFQPLERGNWIICGVVQGTDAINATERLLSGLDLSEFVFDFWARFQGSTSMLLKVLLWFMTYSHFPVKNSLIHLNPFKINWHV